MDPVYIPLLFIGAILGGVLLAYGLLPLVHPLPDPFETERHGETERHREAGHRFLCPACLLFDELHYACPRCSGEVHSVAHLAGPCPHCCAPLQCGEEAPALRAYCRRCGASGDASVLHERQVRVIGVLNARDLELARQEVPGGHTVEDARYLLVDDGRQLTYFLDLQAVDVAGRGNAGHAVRGVDQLWIADAASTPEGLARALDRFVRSTGRGGSHLRACLRAPEVGSEVAAALLTRVGAFRWGVPAAELLTRPPKGPAGMSRVAHVLAAARAEDFEALCAGMQASCRWVLGGGWVSEDTADRVTYLLDLSVLREPQGSFGASPSLSEVQAAWTSSSEPLELSRLADRLTRMGYLAGGGQSGLDLCMDASDVDPAVLRIVDARFGRVRCGVSAEAFLRSGGFPA